MKVEAARLLSQGTDWELHSVTSVVGQGKPLRFQAVEKQNPPLDGKVVTSRYRKKEGMGEQFPIVFINSLPH